MLGNVIAGNHVDILDTIYAGPDGLTVNRTAQSQKIKAKDIRAVTVDHQAATDDKNREIRDKVAKAARSAQSLSNKNSDTEKRNAAIIALLGQGISQANIAAQMGVSKKTVWRVSQAKNNTPRPLKQASAQSRGASIAKMLAEGKSQTDIAKALNISRKSVYRFIRKTA